MLIKDTLCVNKEKDELLGNTDIILYLNQIYPK